MSTEQINKIYDEMYNYKYNQLLNSKNEALGNVDKQEKKSEDDAYNYRNQAAQLHAQTTQSTRDYMAKNNLLQSGENVDSLNRNTSTYMNNDGKILGNLQNQKNEYGLNRNSINNTFNSDVNSWKADVESQRAKALYDYQEKLRQEALQRELEAQRIAAANARSSGGSGSSSKYTATNQKDDVRNEVMSATRNGNPDDISSTLSFVKQAYDQGIISDSEYNQYTTSLNASYRTNTSAQNKINNGTYGYSTTPRNTGTSNTTTSKPKNPKDYFMKW